MVSYCKRTDKAGDDRHSYRTQRGGKESIRESCRARMGTVKRKEPAQSDPEREREVSRGNGGLLFYEKVGLPSLSLEMIDNRFSRRRFMAGFLIRILILNWKKGDDEGQKTPRQGKTKLKLWKKEVQMIKYRNTMQHGANWAEIDSKKVAEYLDKTLNVGKEAIEESRSGLK
jgi:hypothetical protein